MAMETTAPRAADDVGADDRAPDVGQPFYARLNQLPRDRGFDDLAETP